MNYPGKEDHVMSLQDANHKKNYKKKELQDVCESITRVNRDSPFCIVDTSTAAQSFAISLKEGARSLKNTIISLGGLDEQILIHKKIAHSTNTSIAVANHIGSLKTEKILPPFSLYVKSIASPQVNEGYFLSPKSKIGLAPNTYSFDLSINSLSYEFQFNINKNETNEILLNRLVRLINNAGIGVNAYIAYDSQNNCALSISSKSIGLVDNQSVIFTISDTNTSRHSGTVKYLGLDHMTVAPCNANFSLNNMWQSSKVNEFTVEKLIHITLIGASKNEQDLAIISTKQDAESIMENIKIFINSYNRFLEIIESHLTSQPTITKLLITLKKITLKHLSELNIIGITLKGNSFLTLDNEKFLNTVGNLTSATIPKTTYFTALKNFADSVLAKTNDIQLNPMEYVDRKTVEYKNPEAPNYPCPYISSQYSGMMYNKYC